MTGISIVIPVYDVAEFLPACLDSVLASDDPDLEVIAIDDSSTDGSGDILDRRAAADRRLRVVRQEANRGQGAGRNLGLDLAARDYVWFVDGDDALTPGALAAVADAVAAAKPDLLLLGWESVYPGERVVRSPPPAAALLASVPTGGCRLAERPDLVNVSMTAWSKVFRRDFLLRLHGEDVAFGTGIHEDILVSCAALLAADVIGAVGQVCYRYRRGRPGAAMATTSTRHEAVFDAYRQVFDLLARLDAGGQPVTDPVRAAVFERAIWHYSTVLETTGPGVGPVGLPGLVPRPDRRAFFHRMHADFVRYRPAGYRLPEGARGAKFRLIEKDAYALYALLEPLNQARVALRGALRFGAGSQSRFSAGSAPSSASRRLR